VGVEELLHVLKRINKERRDPVDEAILNQVMALVIKHPLDEDRTTCQTQIEEIINQRVGGNRK